MVLREPNDPLNQSRGIMGPLENATGVQNNRGRLRQRFDLIRKLGQGTYGKVQLGIDKETGQEVAIKTIKKSKIETEADLIRIRREIQIMSSVRHPNIIHIYEVFENREKMVLVMEYAAGGELYDYLNERKVLQDDEARRIFRQIASAVYYCHKHKICHRDLKLENILLDEKFNAKIADFGLSNVFDEKKLLTTFCGSPLYASPCIVRGIPYRGDTVDCWSLGVLLYTLVYGAMPFDGSNFKRLVKQISHGDYFEPKKPAEASPLIRLMLTVDPKKRADIAKVCSHPWVNKGFDKDCLSEADELATQTPVRLDLLLALANCSAISHNQVVVDQPNQHQHPSAPPPQPPAGHHDTAVNEMKAAQSNEGGQNEVVDQHAPKKPKRSKMQSKSKSSPMLELIHDVEEDAELGMEKERVNEEGVSQCDTLSEISEIQTLAEDVAGEGGSGANSDVITKTKPSPVKKDPSKVKEPPIKPPVSSTPSEPPVSVTAAAPTVQAVERKLKKTEVEPQKSVEVKSIKKEAPSVVEEDKKKKVVVKPSPSPEIDKPKVEEIKKEAPEKAPVPTQAQAQPSTAAAPAKSKDEKANEAVPSSREVTPAPSTKEKSATPPVKEKSATPPVKEKSATPTDKDSAESGEEGKARPAKLKDRADSVSPTRIERRNSKVISQKTAELIQNLETKVSPSGTTSSVEPPPKPPGIKKIVIPNFKVSDAKSKFESKPPRPLTTSVSRSKAAFEAKLQSQSSIEEKSPPKTTPPKGDSPPATVPPPDQAKPKPTEAQAEPPVTQKPKEEKAKTEKPKSQDAPSQETTTEVPKSEPAKQQSEPVAVPAQKQVPAKAPVKVQQNSTSANDKVAAITPAPQEVKPVLMDSGSGAPRKAVMVVKGKTSSPTNDNRALKSPASPSPQAESEPCVEPQTSTSVCVASDDHPAKNVSSHACNDMGTCVAPPDSCTEGETGKTGSTPPTPLGPAAAAKQKLLSKLPPAPAAVPLQTAQNGSNKEIAVKNITSAISKVVNSGSISKGLNSEEPPKKFSTLPKAAKPESEKIIRTEVSFPVSAPETPGVNQSPSVTKQPSQSTVSNQQAQQPKQERIIPIKFVDEHVNTTPPTPAAPSASPSVTSVSSKVSTTPATPVMSHRDSTGSLFSRQNSSDAESSTATVPHMHEPLRKCPREFLIPIKLEGSGQTVTPKEELTSGGSTADVSQIGGEDDFRIDSRLRSGRFARPKRYSSLLSDSSFDDEPSVSASANKTGGRRASATATPGAIPSTATHARSRSQGDEPTTPGGTFKRYRNRRHATAAPDMPLDRSDSFSSAEEDEEDAFQVLTAESLFSNLLDRVRNLTRRINRDDPMITPNWSTDPTTFGLWGASPLREFMSSRAPSETRSFTSSGPGSYRRESSVSMNSTTGGAPGGAWRRSLSRDLSGESDSGHSASINTTNAQSRSQLSRLSSDLFETSSSRSLPLSSRRSPSYLSHRSVDNDLGSSFTAPSSRTFSRTMSHSVGDYNGHVGTGPVSRTLPLRRSLKTFDRGPQHVVPEYDTTPSSMMRHSLLDSKYETPSSYLARLRSQSRERHQGDREGSVTRMRTLFPSSGEANGWEGGQDAVATSSSLAASTTSTSSYGTTGGGGAFSISPISTAVSLDSESILSPTSSFSYPLGDSSTSRLLSVQEKMNNYSQYYQNLAQRPFRRLPLASPSQIHSNSGGFGVGLSEIKNIQSPVSVSPSAFSRPPSLNPLPGATMPLKVDPSPEGTITSSTSDEGSATPCIQSPVSNPLSLVTSPSISPPQIPSPILPIAKATESQQKPPNEEGKQTTAKPPTATSSIPRWPNVSVRQHRPLSISSFPEGTRASSVTRVMSPPPTNQDTVATTSTNGITNGNVEHTPPPPASVLNLQKRRDSRATSVERITRLLERKSMPREVSATDQTKKKVISDDATGSTPVTNGESLKNIDNEKSTPVNQTSKKPKFLQNLEKKWDKLTNNGASLNSKGDQEVEAVAPATTKSVPEPPNNTISNGIGITSNPASPEPCQAGGTSEESSSHEDKINESVLLRRALSPEKKVKPTSRMGASGGTVNFMLGKFKKLESSTDIPQSSSVSSSSGSRIPTGRPPVSSTTPLASRFGPVGRRMQMPYTGATSDSVLTITSSLAKETGRSAESSGGEETGLIKNAATVAQEKRRLLTHGNVEIRKDVPSSEERPSPTEQLVRPTTISVAPPQIQIDDDNEERKVSSETLPQLDMFSLSPVSVSDDTRTESDEGSGAPTKSNSGSALTASDEPESVSDRILRKSFYNRFNASGNGIDRNRRSSSVTPGSSRKAPLGSPNSLRVNTNNPKQNSPGGGGGHSPHHHRLSNSPSASTVGSVESKESTTGSEQSGSQNRSTSPYLSGLNKYNPNPLFKELMLNEDFRNNDVGKKTEYSRKITSKLSKLLREIESDLNSCQLTKTESDDGESSGLLLCAARFPQEMDNSVRQQPTIVHPRTTNKATRGGSALPIPNTNGNIVNEAA